jgi:hypothetical protein
MTNAASNDEPHVLLVPVPVLPSAAGSGPPELTLAFQRMDGETVAEGYTSAERLIDACGPAQPWVALSVRDSIALLARAGASILVVDRGAAGGTLGVDLTCAVPTPGVPDER